MENPVKFVVDNEDQVHYEILDVNDFDKVLKSQKELQDSMIIDQATRLKNRIMEKMWTNSFTSEKNKIYIKIQGTYDKPSVEIVKKQFQEKGWRDLKVERNNTTLFNYSDVILEK